MSALAFPPRKGATPVQAAEFDPGVDVVVVGGGGAGLPVSLFSRWAGNEVVLLEKAAELGGTDCKAAFWHWVPNEPLRALGHGDPQLYYQPTTWPTELERVLRAIRRPHPEPPPAAHGRPRNGIAQAPDPQERAC
jgi:FAD binding domain